MAGTGPGHDGWRGRPVTPNRYFRNRRWISVDDMIVGNEALAKSVRRILLTDWDPIRIQELDDEFRIANQDKYDRYVEAVSEIIEHFHHDWKAFPNRHGRALSRPSIPAQCHD